MTIRLRQPGEPSPVAEKLPSLSPAGQAAVDLHVSTPHRGAFCRWFQVHKCCKPQMCGATRYKIQPDSEFQTGLPNRRCFIPPDLAKQTFRSFACLYLPKGNRDNGGGNVHPYCKGHFGKRRIFNTILHTNLPPQVAANNSLKG